LVANPYNWLAVFLMVGIALIAMHVVVSAWNKQPGS
jgi:hypothetical protein